MRRKTIYLTTAFLAIGILSVVVVRAVRNYQTEAAALKCIDNLRSMDGGKQQWALECHQSSNAIPTWDELAPYIVNAFYQESNFRYTNYTGPQCPRRGTYTVGRVADAPTCTIPGHDIELLGATVCVEGDTTWHMAGAAVAVIDETGRRRKALTDENGCAKIVTWPKKATAFIVSKEGYVTVSNSYPYVGRLVLQKTAK
jgi:hypothetical protein